MEEVKYPITNSVVFALVMEDPKLCRGLIQRIFPDRKVKEVRIREKPEVITEATLIAGIQAKPIRLDVRFEDGNSWYDIELQVAREGLLPQRSRYYSAMGDVKMLDSGDDYDQLLPSFVIFLCCFDYFKMDEPVYEFQRVDRNLDLLLGDESYIIILNSKCSKDKVPAHLQSLFLYINDSEVTPGDGLIAEIHDRVEALQEREEVKNIMTLEEEFKRRLNGERRRGEEAAKIAAKKAAEEAAKEAAAETEKRLTALHQRLLDDGRMEELRRSLQDSEYRKKLYDDYGL